MYGVSRTCGTGRSGTLAENASQTLNPKPAQSLGPAPSSVKYKFIKTTFIKKSTFIKIQVRQKPISSKTKQKQFHQNPISSMWTLSSKNIFITDQIELDRTKHDSNGKNNIVHISVKASPTEGRGRLHRNTAYAHLSGLNRPSRGASLAKGRRCSAPLRGLLKVERRGFRCSGVQVFMVQAFGRLEEKDTLHAKRATREGTQKWPKFKTG